MGEERITTFTDLPEKIVRRILFSYWTPIDSFTEREAIQLSLVSKQFFNLIENPPILNYSIMSTNNIERNIEDILLGLTWYDEQNIHLHSLSIQVGPANLMDEDDDENMYKCINLTSRKRLTTLDIYMTGSRFVVPQSVFEIESLERLCLGMCSLQLERIPRKYPVWPNLRELCLDGSWKITEEIFEKLIKCCPYIEKLLILWNFPNNAHFKVSNLSRLKKLEIGLRYVKTIEICKSAAINLESISYKQHSPSTSPGISLGKHAYPNLRRLDLDDVVVSDGNFFANFGSIFPQIEFLSVAPPIHTSRIDLSSSSLKELRFHVNNVNDLEEARFDVPNIVHFKYHQKYESAVTILPKVLFTDRCSTDIQKQYSQLSMPFEASIKFRFPQNYGFLKDGRIFESNVRDVVGTLCPVGFLIGLRNFTITQKNWHPFSLSVARALMDAIFKIYQPQTITFRQGSNYMNVVEIKHNVKCVWDTTVNSQPEACEKIAELLKPYDEKYSRFTVVFNLEYCRRTENI